ncbi:MAG: hypothetical protein OEX77_10385 [Candidatus Bathyarchaeota archaeon]|nr:hypothetical protein [Candidatus Bathyarchaeota archaeon]MDH5732817.1 hypothetical protein [Candidatus Bathyarchaeota archaeon]
MKASKMELIEKIPIKIDRKLVSIPLLEKLILYAVDSSHILLAMKPINELEKKSLSKEDVEVVRVGNEYLIELPKKVYDFHRLDEADYKVMVSEINPKTIEILI